MASHCTHLSHRDCITSRLYHIAIVSHRDCIVQSLASSTAVTLFWNPGGVWGLSRWSRARMRPHQVLARDAATACAAHRQRTALKVRRETAARLYA
jgi:hypothetical protein